MRAASLDIGSNTFRLLIAEPDGANSPWKRIHYEHRIVRLGEGLHETGRLSPKARRRALAALGELAEAIRRHGIEPASARAVATAAMREAADGAEFAAEVERACGLRIEIIDGATEAALSAAGASSVLDPEVRKSFLLFDIGGASTEFIRSERGRLVDAESRKLGVVRLVEAHLRSDPPSPGDFEAMRRASLAHLEAVQAGWRDGRVPAHLVGTAGTVTTLAATQMNLVPYDPDRVNNHRMSRASFQRLRDSLLALNHDERQALPTIEPGRADLIVAGLAIVQAVFDFWQHPEMVVVDAGLLEGAWLQAAGLLPGSK